MRTPKSLNMVQPEQTLANLSITASRQHSYRFVVGSKLVLLAEVKHKPAPIPLDQILPPIEQTPVDPGCVLGKRARIDYDGDNDDEDEDAGDDKRARIDNNASDHVDDDDDEDDDEDDDDGDDDGDDSWATREHILFTNPLLSWPPNRIHPNPVLVATSASHPNSTKQDPSQANPLCPQPDGLMMYPLHIDAKPRLISQWFFGGIHCLDLAGVSKTATDGGH